jgi:hypothetical protein
VVFHVYFCMSQQSLPHVVSQELFAQKSVCNFEAGP